MFRGFRLAKLNTRGGEEPPLLCFGANDEKREGRQGPKARQYRFAKYREAWHLLLNKPQGARIDMIQAVAEE